MPQSHRIKLTQKIVERLSLERDGQWVTDSEVPQLVVRLTKTARTYVARWSSPNGGRRQETLARVGDISVAEARSRARKIVAEDRAPKRVESLADVYATWERDYVSTVSERHVADFQSAWRLHIEPHLGKTKLSRLTNAAIQGWYNNKRVDHAPDTVRRWVAYISKLCSIARKHEWMTGNPCEGLEMSARRRRLDIFTRNDILTLGDNLTAAANKYPVGVALLRFLMMYPCRGIEAREMQWSDIDLDAGTWTIPAERYKTGQNKVFPLGPLQVQHLRSLPRWSKRYVFPRPSSAGLGSSRKSAPGVDLPVTKNHQIYVWNQVRPKPLGAHALRKTIGTLMLNDQVPLEVVSKLMGHSTTLVTQQAYAHLEAATARRHLEGWTKFLEQEPVEKDDWVGPVLEAHADLKVTEYNRKLDD